MIIAAHTGYGDITLGSSRATILKQLGEPDQRTLGDLGEVEIEYLEYVNAHLKLGFLSQDGDRLGAITVHSPEAIYEGQRVLGLPIAELISRYPDLEASEDFGEKGRDYIDDPKGLSFWVRDGVVDNVTIFPGWNEDETPRWPEASDIGPESPQIP